MLASLHCPKTWVTARVDSPHQGTSHRVGTLTKITQWNKVRTSVIHRELGSIERASTKVKSPLARLVNLFLIGVLVSGTSCGERR